MELCHIPFENLQIAALNMRAGRKAPDISDILPSVRARGILQPLLVRPTQDNLSGYEIIAGRRRYFCAKTIVEENGTIEPLPCGILDDGDDAAALEASLIENIARLDPDEMTQYETFVRLIKEGRSEADLAATFGITEQMVRRRLALGNLLPKIRAAYRDGDIDAETVRHLTLASKAQQKDWLALFENEEEAEPRGSQLKQWLFGGQTISTKVALFPLDQYPGQIVTDLFGEDGYFADADMFWTLQNEVIAAKREAYLALRWSGVEVLDIGKRFCDWEHEKTPKKKGGKVFITVSHRGEVECHEGWRSRQEARRTRSGGNETGNESGAAPIKSARPEVTSALNTYIDLHRHTAVRAALLTHPGAALRLMVAHAIAGSGHWDVKPEPQRAGGEAIKASLAQASAQAPFAASRAACLALLDREVDDPSVTDGNGDAYQTVAVFARLLTLSDDEVMRILTFVMAETLAAGSAVVEAVGVHLKVDTATVWRPDECFFDLIRDKQVANAMLADVAGQGVADGNVAEKVKVQKQIVRDCLAGANGREKVERWLPGWLAFPVRTYTARGGVNAADQWERVRSMFGKTA
jgi:ParB family chromosome partitioning protein